MNLQYNILATGSDGNCLLFNDIIAIDMGVSWKMIEPYFLKLNLVLLGHWHTDHFMPSTIKRLAQERPTLRFACGEWLLPNLISCGANERQIDIIEPDVLFNYNNFCSIRMYLTEHNAPNCCWQIFINGGVAAFYATDCKNLDHVTAKDYDYYFIETNHTEQELQERIQTKQWLGEYAYELSVAENHMSREAADRFLYNNIGVNSKIIRLHQHKNKGSCDAE